MVAKALFLFRAQVTESKSWTLGRSWRACYLDFSHQACLQIQTQRCCQRLKIQYRQHHSPDLLSVFSTPFQPA